MKIGVNIGHKWRRLFAVGCSHGPNIDPVARAAVLEFKRRWKPDTTIHLGDFVDLAALRSGANGTKDEGEDPEPDIDEGLKFIEQLGVTDIFAGNHEDRLPRLMESPNALIAFCARKLQQQITDTLKRIRCAPMVPWSNRGWKTFGDFKFGHGYIFNENTPRDHAESHGNIVTAHWHRAGMAKGRRDDNPTGYCVGTLTARGNMDYAKARRSTLAWSQGFVWGEYSEHRAALWVHEQPMNESTVWRLPV